MACPQRRTGGVVWPLAPIGLGLRIMCTVVYLWALLFACGWDLTAEGADYARALAMYLWWLVVLGVPLS